MIRNLLKVGAESRIEGGGGMFMRLQPSPRPGTTERCSGDERCGKNG